MPRWNRGLKPIVTRAKEKALRRRQRLSTAHVLVVFFQDVGEPSALLKGHGLRESDLLSALKLVAQEPVGALEISMEKAEKLARRLGQAVSDIHLLAILCRDSRTAANRCLQHTKVDTAALRSDVMRILGVTDPDRPRAKARRSSRPPKRLRTEGAPARRPLPPRSPRRGNPVTPTAPVPSTPATQATPATPAPQVEAEKGKPGVGSRSAAVTPAAATEALHWYDLDAEAFPMLNELGRNLTAAAAAGEIDPLVGREPEIEQLLDILARRRSNNPLLVGSPGVGKTALVEGLALRLFAGDEGTQGLEERIIVEVSPGSLVSGTGVRGALAQRLKKLREEVKRSSGRVVLFIDETHAVVGGGEGPDDLAHELKASLSRGELPCVGATTEDEFRKHFERDAALARRFTVVHVEEPSPEQTKEILAGLGPRYERHHAVEITDEAYGSAVDLSVRFMPERRLPDKAIGIVDMAAARTRRRGGSVVGRVEVAAVVAEQARVPIERLTMDDGERLLRLEALMGERIVGHGDALTRIGDTLRKGAAGFRGRRPLGTFLLLGPTGVGKTETARTVSELIFPTGGMTRIDMSEYTEAHAVARLVGAPPGYVGHDEGGQLTDAVRRRPYQLILLDEVDKAHPEVLLTLLPLLDEGRMTDGRGRTVDFTNTIIFMTSNYGAASAGGEGKRIGFSGGDGGEADQEGDRWLAAARRALPPEFWNRIDEPLFFRSLSRDEVSEIASRMLRALVLRLREDHALDLRVDDSAIGALIEAGGFDPALGARPMRRVIGRLVEAPLANLILAGEFDVGDVVELVGEGQEVSFRRVSGAAAAE